MPKTRKKISKSEWTKIVITSTIIISLILLRWWTGKILPEPWEFINQILVGLISVMFLPLVYFIMKQLGIKTIKFR